VRRRVLTALIVALLAAAGCGPLGRDEYRERADSICRQMRMKEALLDAIDPLHDVRSYARRGREVVAYDQRARERLGKLRAPNELKDRARAYLVALDHRLDLQRRAVNAAKRGDVVVVIATKPRSGPARERQAAERAGLEVCGKG
jgi:hypothetical protein